MPQLQEALATAIAAVLVSAVGAGQSLAHVLPPLPPLPPAGERTVATAAAGDGCTHVPCPQDPMASWAVQVAVAAVLCNAQRHAPALRAACAGAASAEGPRLQQGLQTAAAAADSPAALRREPHAQSRARAALDALAVGAVAAEQPSAGGRAPGLERVHEGEAATEVARPTAQPALGGVVRHRGAKWTREQLEVMVQHMKQLPRTRSNNATREAMHKLGLDGQPDPDRRLSLSVSSKLNDLRNLLAHGHDPLEDIKDQRAKPNTYHWRAWLRKAYMALPGRMGTLNSAAAILESDPAIAPLLDRRPYPRARDCPRWKRSISDTHSLYPEFEDTGQKRGRQMVYRYNLQVAEKEEAQKKLTAPKRSVPYLGKDQ